MPRYEIKIILANGEIKKEECSFTDRDEAFEYALGNYQGKWKINVNNNARTTFENNTIPVSIEVVDIIQNDIETEIRTQKHLADMEEWSKTPPRKPKTYGR